MKNVHRLYNKFELFLCPSIVDGTLTSAKELSYRQEAAAFIRDVSNELCLRQLAINTACAFMHRFFMHHSIKIHKRYDISSACVFFASKVEEQPKKLDELLKVCYYALYKKKLENRTTEYFKESEKLKRNENLLLQTLDFEYKIEHPHPHIINITSFLNADRQFSHMAYFMASNSLYLTPFCVLYKPVVVAAMCIYLSIKWSRLELPYSTDGRPFWKYMDETIEEETLKELTVKFVAILQKYPKKLAHMKSFMSMNNNKKPEEKPANPNQPTHSGGHQSSTSRTHQRRPKHPVATIQSTSVPLRRPLSTGVYNDKGGGTHLPAHPGQHSSTTGPPKMKLERSQHQSHSNSAAASGRHLDKQYRMESERPQKQPTIPDNVESHEALVERYRNNDEKNIHDSILAVDDNPLSSQTLAKYYKLLPRTLYHNLAKFSLRRQLSTEENLYYQKLHPLECDLQKNEKQSSNKSSTNYTGGQSQQLHKKVRQQDPQRQPHPQRNDVSSLAVNSQQQQQTMKRPYSSGVSNYEQSSSKHHHRRTAPKDWSNKPMSNNTAPYSRSNSSSRHSSSYKTTQHNTNGSTINQRKQHMAHSSNNTNRMMNGTMSSSSNAAMASYPVAATTSSSSTTSFERPTFDNKVPDDLFDDQS